MKNRTAPKSPRRRLQRHSWLWLAPVPLAAAAVLMLLTGSASEQDLPTLGVRPLPVAPAGRHDGRPQGPSTGERQSPAETFNANRGDETLASENGRSRVILDALPGLSTMREWSLRERLESHEIDGLNAIASSSEAAEEARRMALWLLAKHGDLKAARSALELGSVASEPLMLQGIQAIRAFGEPRDRKHLISVAGNDAAPTGAREAAIRALGDSSDKSSIASIKSCLSSEVAELRRASIEALSAQRTGEAAEALIAHEPPTAADSDEILDYALALRDLAHEAESEELRFALERRWSFLVARIEDSTTLQRVGEIWERRHLEAAGCAATVASR